MKVIVLLPGHSGVIFPQTYGFMMWHMGTFFFYVDVPMQWVPPAPLSLSFGAQIKLDSAMLKFLEHGIVELWAPVGHGFLCTIFPPIKRDGTVSHSAFERPCTFLNGHCDQRCATLNPPILSFVSIAFLMLIFQAM